VEDLPEVAPALAMDREYRAIGCESGDVYDPRQQSCRWGSGGPKIVLLGDSYARQHIPVLREAVPEMGGTLYALTKSACPVTLSEIYRNGRRQTDCERWLQDNLAAIKDSPPELGIVSGAYDVYATADG